MNIFISKRTSLNLRNVLTGTAGLLVVLVFWKHLSSKYHPLILPSPNDTWLALLSLAKSGELTRNILITLKRTINGYSLALLLGFLLALLLKRMTFWQALLRPLITVIQVIPPVIWMLFAVLWFGIADDLTPIFLIFIVTFPVTFVQVFASLDSIDHRLVQMAKVYRCSPSKIITGIYVPALIPHLISTISVGLSFAWKSTIFAEFIGSSSGVGFALSMANNNLETDILFSWTLILVVFMLLCEYGLLQPLRLRTARWSNEE